MADKIAIKRPYEVVILMHPDCSLEEQKSLFQKNKGIIEQFGGEVHSLETWGKRNLANQINKLKKALYFHSTFQTSPQAIAELERTMGINDRVLRFTHTRLDERVPLSKFMETFKRGLGESSQREKEREAKAIARRQAAAAAREGRD